MVSEGGDEPIAIALVGRRGGAANVCGICIGEVIWSAPRACDGAGRRLGGVSDSFAVAGAFADLRGGGRFGLGLGMSSSSCCSLAETKDMGEDAFSLLSIDSVLDSRLKECVRSSDLGRTYREPLCGGGFGRCTVVLIMVNCGGFCFSGGVPNESFLS
jgi:hypothetical protein